MDGGAGDYARRAAALAAEGRTSEAEALFDQAMAIHPGDARLANSAGNFHARQGRDARALELFEQAIERDPTFAEATINAAIVLLRLGRPRAANALLSSAPTPIRSDPRFLPLRSDSAKALGYHALADLLLAEAEGQGAPRLLPRRARLSLERGDANAIAQYEAALAATPGNFALMQGYMQALAAGGQLNEALDFGRALAGHFPSWVEGQATFAELRWEAGDKDYTSHFATAAAAHPIPELYLEWAALLSGNDDHATAADVLARAGKLWPADPRIVVRRAMALEEAGLVEEAEASLANAAAGHTADRILVSARLDLRRGRVDAAEKHLAAVVAADRENVAAWGLRDLCWRLMGDPRHDWLHGQHGLVREMALPISPNELDALREVLRQVHAGASIPLAQSVKGGTQSRGALFARPEPEIARLRAALAEVLDEYRRGLPTRDPAHPLLAHRDESWIISGSWSVRFTGSGRHAAHIHPQGLLSSACYIEVPSEVDAPGGPGWLELGASPDGIAPELGPLTAIRPKPGKCVLFPSTLFHGTRPIGSGERMSVAFDVGTPPG